MFQHLQNQESKHTEESTRQTPDDKDQQGGEKMETYKTDKVEVKKTNQRVKNARQVMHQIGKKSKTARRKDSHKLLT